MNKKFLYYFLAVVIVGGIPGTTYILRTHFSSSPKPQACTLEAKICPDGSSVGRTGPNCEFAMCPITKTTSTSSLEVTTATSTNIATTSTFTQNIPKTTETQPTTPNSKVSSAFSSIVNIITFPFKKNPTFVSTTNYYPTNSPITPSTYISNSETNNSVYKPLPPENFAGEKYIVKDGNILSNDNKVVYTIPQEIINNVSSSNPGWTNTIINVIQVGTVAPILNAIPITDLPGKYYLSQNSFGNIENCEFSNKIFILDTISNTVTLMYEENNTTLSRDDPRACNSEIFLLTTENNKLILKYHTIGTNTLCDSAWSEPEKTFYLDVTKLRTEGMKKYVIPENLSATAEQEEEACRNSL